MSLLDVRNLIADLPTAEVLRAPQHPYTQGLLAASPSLSLQKKIDADTRDGAAAYRVAAGLRF